MHAYLSEIRSCFVLRLSAFSLHGIVLSHHISFIKSNFFLIKTCHFSLSQNILNILALSMNAVIELPSTRSVI